MRYREPVIRKRGKRWQIDYVNPEGRRRQLTAGHSRDGAERLRIKFVNWLLDGKDPEVELESNIAKLRNQNVTIKALFPVFMERHAVNRSAKMQESYRTSYSNVCRCPQLAECPLSKINQATVLDYMNARIRQDDVKPATVNREKAFLSAMLSKAVAWGYLDRNPVEGMESFREPRKRDVELSPEQAAQLLDELPTREMKNIVAFAIYSGLRQSTILGLRIEDVFFQESGPLSRVMVTDKGGDRVERIMSQHATVLLKSVIGDKTSGYVFINPRTGKPFGRRLNSFDKAVKKLGLTAKDGSKLRFHDLRHVYGNWLHRAGVSLDELRVLYGHRDRATTDRYVTPDLEVISARLALQPRITKPESRRSNDRRLSET